MKLPHPLVFSPLLALGLSVAQAQSAANSPGSTSNLTDPQILEVLYTLDKGEIEQAQLALKKSQSAEVKKVAQAILADNTKSSDSIEKLGTPPDQSALSRKLLDHGAAVKAQLDATTEKRFDCAWLTVQAAQHTMALTTAREVLLPDAESETVKNFLTEMEPKLEQHQRSVRAQAAKLCSA